MLVDIGFIKNWHSQKGTSYDWDCIPKEGHLIPRFLMVDNYLTLYALIATIEYHKIHTVGITWNDCLNKEF